MHGTQGCAGSLLPGAVPGISQGLLDCGALAAAVQTLAVVVLPVLPVNCFVVVVLLLTGTPPVEMYMVVGFEVSPCSIKRVPGKPIEHLICDSGDKLPPAQEVALGEKIMFTYDVYWEKNDKIKWASRWDSYLRMPGGKVHWFSIMNSMLIVLVMASLVAMILIRTIRRDLSKYEQLMVDSSASDLKDEAGWKLLTGDVFRSPNKAKSLVVHVSAGGGGRGQLPGRWGELRSWYMDGDHCTLNSNGSTCCCCCCCVNSSSSLYSSSEASSVCIHSFCRLLLLQVGSGVQTLLVATVTLLLATFGFLSPASRGALLTTAIVLFVLLSFAAGASAVALWGMVERSYEGWVGVALQVSLWLPGLIMMIFTVLNIALKHTGSLGAVPAGIYFSIVAIWFLVSVPLTFVGGFMGTRLPILDFPVKTNQIPRQIPPAPVVAHPVLLFFSAGERAALPQQLQGQSCVSVCTQQQQQQVPSDKAC